MPGTISGPDRQPSPGCAGCAATSRKGRYIDFLDKVASFFRNPSWEGVLREHSPIAYRVTSYLASVESLLYREHGGASHLDAARTCFITLCKNGIQEFGLHAAGFVYECLRKAEALHEHEIRDAEDRLISSALESRGNRLESTRPRIHNHATFGMVGSAMIADLLPQRSESELLRAYADELWEDWLAIRENPEVTSLYEPFTQTSVMRMAELRNEEVEYYVDSIVKDTFDRYLQQLSPIGVMTQYGDAAWATAWGFWVAVFEKAASIYNDGRFAWAAESIFEYGKSEEFLGSLGDIDRIRREPVALQHGRFSQVLLEAYGLVLACLWCNDAIEEKLPDGQSETTYRYLPSESEPSKRGDRAQEKLILRNGWNRGDWYMVVGLLRTMWHDQYDAGSILLFTCEASVLLKDTGYFWRQPRFHNVFLVRPENEEFLGEQDFLSQESFAFVSHLSAQSRVTFAQIYCKNHQGYPVEHTRNVIFVGGQKPLVALWDVVHVQEGRYRVGPIFHTQEVVWLKNNACDTAHRILGGQGIEWVNAPHNLLVAFPAEDSPIKKGSPRLPGDYWKSFSGTSWTSLYQGVRKQHECIYTNAVVDCGQSLAFLTVLIPHPQREDAREIARSIRLLNRHALACCVRIGSDLLITNSSDGIMEFGRVSTDAKLLYLSEEEQNGYAAFCGARKLRVGERELLDEKKAADGEFDF